MVSAERQQMLKAVAAGTSSGLSIVGSVYILGRYWYGRRMRARASPGSAIHHVDVTKELIHVLAWMDLVGAIGRVFGVLPTKSYSEGESVSDICKLQAYVIAFGDLAPIVWNFVMALNLFRWVCIGEDQQMLKRKIKWYIFGAVLFTLTVNTVALAFDTFAAAGLWCWIALPNDHTAETYWKLGVLYIWVLLGALAMVVLLVLVKMDVQERLKGVDNEDARVAYHGVVQNLTIYILAFIACWSPAVLDRGYQAITGQEIFTLSMMHASFVPLQGFVNAVIYGKFHVWIGRHVQRGRASTKVLQRESNRPWDANRVAEERQKERGHFGNATIFVTSFDMNWSPFPPNLDDWIPANNDVYVFSLQHCLGVQQVEQAIRRHLLKINYPTGYRSITSLAGSQYRGNSQDAAVCQIVFVNNADIASGNFHFHASEGRMWTQRKAFKEIVGIPMRYFEASLAFISCNLTSVGSTSSQSRLNQSDMGVSSKHAATMSLIRSFDMDADRAAVDFPYLYHHTFLSGNLNYNVDVSSNKLMVFMDQAYKAECLRRATDAAVDSKLRAFGHSHTATGRRAADEQKGTQQTFREPANSNVPVEWNLLYFKSRGSLGRASSTSSSSADDIESYEELYSATHDGLPFTMLRSPQKSIQDQQPPFLSVSQNTPAQQASFLSVSQDTSGSLLRGQDVRIQVDGAHQTEISNTKESSGKSTWFRFLEDLFPNNGPRASQANPSAFPRASGSQLAEVLASSRGESKRIYDWIRKADLAAGSAERKWQELVRNDELRAAIDAKEVLCGFEEPPITFLPSYPRRVGASASYSMLTDKSPCKDLFLDSSEGLNEQPSYKDRILHHSLSDTKDRIRNVKYWLCEEILTSSHKPICSIYELEVDRFFAFKNSEAAISDQKAGNMALREKKDVQEFKIKLVNLDANIWTYQTVQRPNNPLWRLRTAASESTGEQQTSTKSGVSVGDIESSYDNVQSSTEGKTRSFSQRFGKKKRMDRSNSARSIGRQSTGSSHGGSSFSNAKRSGLDTDDEPQVELVPIDPSSISTLFPLPSEDVYALQRKVYEVAHSVQSGFQTSAKDEESEESLLAYTNFRTVTWKEASMHGVMHSAITKAVNGVIHVAIKVRGGEKGQGGQGVLCIQEEDLIKRATPVIGEAEPIPFDIQLTWGGKHVGYLHGDILSGL